MQYRNFGKINFKPSSLGFGLMRLPVKLVPSVINYNKAESMLRYAIENGINYFDTAYVYHLGQSEVFLGKAIKKNNWREKIKIASKLPIWKVGNKDDPEKIFSKQLSRLQTDHIDFYLLHALGKETWEKVKDFDIISWMEKKIAQGKIINFGFSFHDQFTVFKEIVDSYDKWSFCQIQYNFLDPQNQAGVKGLKYAAQKGLGVIIMSPLMGGKLSHASKAVENVWNKAENKKSPTEWALQWLWNQPEVSLVLSGMNTLEQVKENIEFASRSKINSMIEKEVLLIEEVRQKYSKLTPIPCTKCEYCLPCPQKVNIPRIFEIYNDSVVFDNLAEAKKQYLSLKSEEKTGNCIQCKKCESLCPQKIKITEKLKEVEKVLNPDNK